MTQVLEQQSEDAKGWTRINANERDFFLTAEPMIGTKHRWTWIFQRRREAGAACRYGAEVTAVKRTGKCALLPMI